MAKLYFHFSTMNAGKSTLLLQASYNYRERGMQTYLMTARLDTRAGRGRIASRIGIAEKSDLFAPGEDLFAKIAQASGRRPGRLRLHRRGAVPAKPNRSGNWPASSTTWTCR